MPEVPVDAITTIFIFLVGLPAIMLQILPSEIRRTVIQERGQLIVYTLTPIVLSVLLVLGGLAVPWIWREAPDYVFEWAWVGFTMTMLFVAGLAALLFTERWRRRSVVRRFVRVAGRGIPQRGRPLESVLEKLMELGTQSHGGDDKRLVIAGLAELCARTQKRSGYDGAQIEALIQGLEEILVSGAHQGSARNFQQSADLLMEVVVHARDRDHSDDLKTAVQTISALSRFALAFDQAHVQLKFIEALSFAAEGDRENGYATWVSQALFEIGSEAVESEQILVAMIALSKLETIVARHSPVGGELASDFVGLLAHFWAHGDTGRSYSRPFLAEADSFFARSLIEVAETARAACVTTARFQTADYLSRMISEYDSEQ